ncbi:hypothetical protein P5673_002560 [Acropora cervicornis]|uniref:Uncharacterized protein n=1 Tax=Acropora cervicornis TaxID=6130 RepID=A0AAD9R3U1_ACRCE|nr:hypothetical protein P5673_002560 [Acropora cervicornis]
MYLEYKITPSKTIALHVSLQMPERVDFPEAGIPHSRTTAEFEVSSTILKDLVRRLERDCPSVTAGEVGRLVTALFFKMTIDGAAQAKAVYPVIVVTAIWVIVGGFIPFLIKGQNRSWVCAYFAQLNPLIGPEMLPEQLAAAAREWGNKNV